MTCFIEADEWENGFQITNLCAKGSYGEVHHAVKSGRPYAIKLHRVSNQNAKTTEQYNKDVHHRKCYKRIYREMKILRALRLHPNIIKLVTVYDCSQNSHCKEFGLGAFQIFPRLRFVFEMMDSSLHLFLMSHVLSETHVLSIIHQIACALEYMHNSEIIHRDIKPENIMVRVANNNSEMANELADTAEIYIKVADFGNARVMRREDIRLRERYAGLPSKDLSKIISEHERHFLTEHLNYADTPAPLAACGDMEGYRDTPIPRSYTTSSNQRTHGSSFSDVDDGEGNQGDEVNDASHKPPSNNTEPPTMRPPSLKLACSTAFTDVESPEPKSAKESPRKYLHTPMIKTHSNESMIGTPDVNAVQSMLTNEFAATDIVAEPDTPSRKGVTFRDDVIVCRVEPDVQDHEDHTPPVEELLANDEAGEEELTPSAPKTFNKAMTTSIEYKRKSHQFEESNQDDALGPPIGEIKHTMSCEAIQTLAQMSQDGIPTPQFQAPEILLCYKSYTSAVDIWAFGCVIFEVVSRLRCLCTTSDGTVKHQVPALFTARARNNSNLDELYMPQILEFCGHPSEDYVDSLKDKLHGRCHEWFVSALSKHRKTFLNPGRDVDALRTRYSDNVGAKSLLEFDKNITQLCDIINNCLQFIPDDRSAVDEILNHPLFEGMPASALGTRMVIPARMRLHDSDEQHIVDQAEELMEALQTCLGFIWADETLIE